MDTRNKRASVLGFALAALVVLPAPDGTVQRPDRQQTAFSYAGLSAQAPIVATPDVEIIVRSRVTEILVKPQVREIVVRGSVTEIQV